MYDVILMIDCSLCCYMVLSDVDHIISEGHVNQISRKHIHEIASTIPSSSDVLYQATRKTPI